MEAIRTEDKQPHLSFSCTVPLAASSAFCATMEGEMPSSAARCSVRLISKSIRSIVSAPTCHTQTTTNLCCSSTHAIPMWIYEMTILLRPTTGDSCLPSNSQTVNGELYISVHEVIARDDFVLRTVHQEALYCRPPTSCACGVQAM